MNSKWIACCAAVVAVSATVWSPAQGAGDLAQQEPIEVRIELGRSGSNEHAFVPNELTFETGKLYKLIVHNPSPNPHYFTSGSFADKIYTRKIQIAMPGDPAARIAEAKGTIREVEVYPGGSLEWWFVPVATGTITDLRCGIKDANGVTHADQGMIGAIVIR